MCLHLRTENPDSFWEDSRNPMGNYRTTSNWATDEVIASLRIKPRTSFGTAGRPGLPHRIFQVQNRRKPFRWQPMTVEASTRNMLERNHSRPRSTRPTETDRQG